MDLPHLRSLRQRAVLTQNQLSEKSGVARDTISKLESGHRRAYPTTVQKLASALEMKPGQLVGGVEFFDSGPPSAPEPETEPEERKPRRRAGF